MLTIAVFTNNRTHLAYAAERLGAGRKRGEGFFDIICDELVQIS
jgi:hypothetical protein